MELFRRRLLSEHALRWFDRQRNLHDGVGCAVTPGLALYSDAKTHFIGRKKRHKYLKTTGIRSRSSCTTRISLSYSVSAIWTVLPVSLLTISGIVSE
jgi:hypothetical protein